LSITETVLIFVGAPAAVIAIVPVVVLHWIVLPAAVRAGPAATLTEATSPAA
jgi:hypothetical protein